jgi:hypothetical protein
MKRILGTVAALAGVLAFGTSSHAALITYDVSGATTVQTVSSFAPPPGYFTTPVSSGSSLTLNNDANGDSITGDYTIDSSTLNVNSVTNIGGGAIVITTAVVASFTGGAGTLSGSDILWSAPAAFIATGTLVCTGPQCGVIGLTAGATYPISVLNTIASADPVPNPVLGTWNLSADLSQILSSDPAVTGVFNAASPAGEGVPYSWYSFRSVPEPGSLALVLLGLGGLALRSRKA